MISLSSFFAGGTIRMRDFLARSVSQTFFRRFGGVTHGTTSIKDCTWLIFQGLPKRKIVSYKKEYYLLYIFSIILHVHAKRGCGAWPQPRSEIFRFPSSSRTLLPQLTTPSFLPYPSRPRFSLIRQNAIGRMHVKRPPHL